MQSEVDERLDSQVQERISRIAEGVLMLSGAFIGVMLLGYIAFSFFLTY